MAQSAEEAVVESVNEIDLIKGLFEAVLFLSNEPVPLSFFTKNFSIDPSHARKTMKRLIAEFEGRDGGIKILEVSNGYQFVTHPRYADQIRAATGLSRSDGLTKGMLETLSIIAYKQPVVLADIDELRGVSSRMMVVNLMKKKLVLPVGRLELPGRPLSYGTTKDFLRYFGLNKISDLPKLSEIREFSFSGEE